jgi:hypothetical protein
VDTVVRAGRPDDVLAICAFGAAHLVPHYAPLIGAEAADAQVRTWWNAEHIGAAVADGVVVVAESDGSLVGVGQRGRHGDDHAGVFYEREGFAVDRVEPSPTGERALDVVWRVRDLR